MVRVLLPLLCFGLFVSAAEPPQSKAAAPAPAPATSAPAQKGAPAVGGGQENPPDKADSAPLNLTPSKMQTALEKQLASVRKQVSGYMAIGEPRPSETFLLPWPKPAVAATNISYQMLEPACEPMREADLDAIVKEAAERQKVSPKLIRAMIAQESAGRPCAVSRAGAQGLMQLMPEVQRELAVEDPFDARQSVEAGTRLLRSLMDRYAGDVPKALAAYNAGPGAVDRSSGIPPIPETIDYVAKIVKRIE